MSRALDWIDDRPTLRRAAGKNGRVYRIEQDQEGCWTLRRSHATDSGETVLSCGILADMKALANAEEQSLHRPAPDQAISWTRIGDGHWWGVATCGAAYKILKVGRIEGAMLWRLEAYANEDAERGAYLDEGSLPAMKRRAAEDARNEARERSSMEFT